MIGNRLLSCPIVSASRWIETSLAQLAQLPCGSCVVHNGIDQDRFSAAGHKAEAKLGERKSWTLGMVARLDAVKDHATLIRGFSLFAADVPQAHAQLRIIGDGPRLQELKNLASELGVAGQVQFLGTRTDIPEQLAELDVFVFSTTAKEGFGNVLIEALAAGVPVVANDVPSSNEVLRGGAYGKLVTNIGPGSWAQALTRHWHEGPKVTRPTVAQVDAAYGIDQFRDGYLAALGLLKR